MSFPQTLPLLQQRLIKALEVFEPHGKTFALNNWQKPADAPLQGHGCAALLRGDVFEKAGVNISFVQGTLPPSAWKDVKGAESSEGRFEACGLSVVVHPRNPFVPTVHLNIRWLKTSEAWFGGGADMTPIFAFPEDNQHFHGALQNACDAHGQDYATHKKACDTYFTLKHYNEPRGAGGIFYEHLPVHTQTEAFQTAVVEKWLESYTHIVTKRQNIAYSAFNRAEQTKKRAKYVEFNLLYDRGTRFGFQSGGNPENILMSLPPVAGW